MAEVTAFTRGFCLLFKGKFIIIYNAGVGLMCIMLAVRGICEGPITAKVEQLAYPWNEIPI